VRARFDSFVNDDQEHENKTVNREVKRLPSLSIEPWSFEPRIDGGNVEFDELNLCIQLIGDCLMDAGARQVALCGATLNLMSSGSTYHFRVGEKRLSGVSIDIPSAWLSRLDIAAPIQGFLGMTEPRLMELGRRIYQEALLGDEMSDLAIQGLVLELIVELKRREKAKHRIAPGWIRKLQQHIEQDPARTPTLEELAVLVDFHPVHVARSFREFTGKTIGEYIRSTRLDCAQRLLEDRHLSIAEVAHLAGFVDQSHLTRLFRKCLKLTPKQFRELRH
jgi:AraC family transcriptional regulator